MKIMAPALLVISLLSSVNAAILQAPTDSSSSNDRERIVAILDSAIVLMLEFVAVPISEKELRLQKEIALEDYYWANDGNLVETALRDCGNLIVHHQDSLMAGKLVRFMWVYREWATEGPIVQFTQTFVMAPETMIPKMLACSLEMRMLLAQVVRSGFNLADIRSDMSPNDISKIDSLLNVLAK